jgi:hypothetical protein
MSARQVTHQPAALAAARAWLRRLRARLFTALLRYLTGPIRRDGSATAEDIQSLAKVLCRGDVLLSAGNTRVSVLVKCLTRSAWSHVSMYVGPLDDSHDPRCVVEADIEAGVRSIRLSELNALNICVLRPTGLDHANRLRLAEWVVGRIGSEYDHAHAWLLGRRLLRLPTGRALLQPAPDTVAGTATRFICCSLLTHAFAFVGLAIAPVQACPGSTAGPDLGNVTPGDFERAAVFEVIGPAAESA